MIELNKIYCENNLDTMARMPDNFVDMVVTSPPYDNLRDYKTYTWDFERVATELYRIIKQGGVVVWVVNDASSGGSESLTSFKQAIYFVERCGFNLHDTMIYEKENPLPVPVFDRYYQQYEFMFVFTKGRPKTFNKITRKRKNKHHDTREHRDKFFNRGKDGEFNYRINHVFNERVKVGNIWSYIVGGAGNSSKDADAYQHPAIFPELLAFDHIFSWSNAGDLIYDPFMGSGTTAKMAHLLQRKWIGSEISQEYTDLANARLKQYTDQLTVNDIFNI